MAIRAYIQLDMNMMATQTNAPMNDSDLHVNMTIIIKSKNQHIMYEVNSSYIILELVVLTSDSI
jgi:hypothetical protein